MRPPEDSKLQTRFGFAAISLLVIVGAIYASRIPGHQKAQGELVGHTRRVLNALSTLALHVTEAESGQRGYLLTGGHETYLAPYLAAKSQIQRDVDQVARLTADNPNQQLRLQLLRDDIAAKLRELKETIELHKSGEQSEAMRLVLENHGRNLMVRIKLRIDAMAAEEVNLLRSRLSAWESTAWWTQLVFLVGSLLLYVLICTVLLAVSRVSRERKRWAEAEARTAAIQQIEAQRLAQIVGVQKDIAGHSLDLQRAMDTVTASTQNLTHADSSIVEMLEGEMIVYRAASGAAARFVGMRLNPLNSLSGLAIRTDQALRCDDSETDPRVDRVACRKVGLRSMIVVPLRHKGQPVGVLKVSSAAVNQFTNEDVHTLELIAGLLSATLSDAIAADSLRSANHELEKANADLEVLACTDGLTGLTNHRRFKELLDREYQRANRYASSLSLVLLDVDHFKQFNDRFGHPAGDAVLKRVADLLQLAARGSDIIARYGGEEFAILLPETDAEDAVQIADRIRHAIANDPWRLRDITISLGVSSADQETGSWGSLLQAADEALYTSKRNGRNQVTHSQMLTHFAMTGKS